MNSSVFRFHTFTLKDWPKTCVQDAYVQLVDETSMNPNFAALEINLIE
jgi:hypothetical protein